jgi:hypothetical protein
MGKEVGPGKAYIGKSMAALRKFRAALKSEGFRTTGWLTVLSNRAVNLPVLFHVARWLCPFAILLLLKYECCFVTLH